MEALKKKIKPVQRPSRPQSATSKNDDGESSQPAVGSSPHRGSTAMQSNGLALPPKPVAAIGIELDQALGGGDDNANKPSLPEPVTSVRTNAASVPFPGIPGLFMASSSHQQSQTQESSTVPVETSGSSSLAQPKYPRASDKSLHNGQQMSSVRPSKKRPYSGDSGDWRNNYPTERPFGTRSDEEEELVFDVSDDEAMETYEKHAKTPSTKTLYQQAMAANNGRNIPSLPPFANPHAFGQGNSRPTSAVGTPGARPPSANVEEMESSIQALKRMIEEKEHRRKRVKLDEDQAKQRAAASHSPAFMSQPEPQDVSVPGYGAPEAMSEHAPAIEQRQRNGAQDLSLDHHGNTDDELLGRSKAVVQEAEILRSQIVAKPASPAVPSSRAPFVAHEQRRAQITSNLTLSKSTVAKNNQRLALLMKEMEEIQKENQEREEETMRLAQELEELGHDTAGMDLKTLQAKKDDIVQQQMEENAADANLASSSTSGGVSASALPGTEPENIEQPEVTSPVESLQLADPTEPTDPSQPASVVDDAMNIDPASDVVSETPQLHAQEADSPKRAESVVVDMDMTNTDSESDSDSDSGSEEGQIASATPAAERSQSASADAAMAEPEPLVDAGDEPPSSLNEATAPTMVTLPGLGARFVSPTLGAADSSSALQPQSSAFANDEASDAQMSDFYKDDTPQPQDELANMISSELQDLGQRNSAVPLQDAGEPSTQIAEVDDTESSDSDMDLTTSDDDSAMDTDDDESEEEEADYEPPMSFASRENSSSLSAGAQPTSPKVEPASTAPRDQVTSEEVVGLTEGSDIQDDDVQDATASRSDGDTDMVYNPPTPDPGCVCL
ncbi:hypothetical protein K402DRAFT_351101 [Aulographum hederae CBS 113979]|uniref:Uncharacterized protein n=1 Tax=Aulographum hederae CBS 113979 TaxID=1176131 RepID=A0A6G1H6T1_9PEZI|nr:hypothetical protein K402DRAFT_351101 [Aulographum hederae CBS 113979]